MQKIIWKEVSYFAFSYEFYFSEQQKSMINDFTQHFYNLKTSLQ